MGEIHNTQFFKAVQENKMDVSHKGARSLIMKVERDEILEELMSVYIDARLK